MSGCKKGALIAFPKTEALAVDSITVVDYDATDMTLRVKGTVQIEGAVGLNQLQFFDSPTCSGVILGQVLVQDFSFTGLTLELPFGQKSQIYVRTDSIADCNLAFEYEPTVTVVDPPVFVATSPASPSRTSFEPAVIGDAFPISSTISFYSDSLCTVALGSGPATTFKTPGIQLLVTPNATSPIYARTADLRGQLSTCVKLTDYTHTTATSPNPVFTSADPVSPTNVTTTPLIKGTLAAPGDVVIVYSDSSCTAEVGRGHKADLEDQGIAATILGNTTTNLYARALDVALNPSDCVFLTTYVNDTVAPSAPTFINASPASPTKATNYPKFTGTLPSDAVTIRFYNSATCQTQIGSGRKTDYEGAGITVSVTSNTTNSIYARALDGAGNMSPCAYLADYVHDSLPPEAPIFNGTTPASPTNMSITPLVYGATSAGTVLLHFYNDEFCTTGIGSGTTAQFEDTGIQITAQTNTTIGIYGTATDDAGNVSECGFLSNYSHSNNPAPSPVFSLSYPTSPSRSSNTPYIVGTAPNSVTSVGLFSDNVCTTSFGSGTRLTFSTSGIRITVPTNASTVVYAQSTDIYGNNSPCIALTTYIHNTIPPMDPTFTSTNPTSPTNVSSMPTIFGTSYANPASQLAPNRVAFFDSSSCVSKIGEGLPSAYSSTGISLGLPENSVTQLYGKAFDAAGNQSNCVYLTDYTHDTLLPGRPLFQSSTPSSPSYSPKTNIIGTFAGSTDFLPRTSVQIYSDSGCTVSLASGSPTAFSTTGIPVTVPTNASTLLFGASFNEVGNKSTCSQLVNFTHNSNGPANLSATPNNDGSISLSWLADSSASPTPTYVVKRAVAIAGPYTFIASGLNSSSYRDSLVSNGHTYYYKVAASNATGTSDDSAAVWATVAPSAPAPGASLSVTTGANQVRLSWSGFSQDMSYKLLRSTQRGGPYTTILSEYTATNYYDSGLTNGTTYYYVVRGANPSGVSQNSNEVSVVPLAAPAPPIGFRLEPVRNLAACGNGAGLQLSWAYPNHYDSFDIFRETGYGTALLVNTTLNSAVDCNPSNYNTNRNYYALQARWGAGSSLETAQLLFYENNAFGVSVRPGNNHILLALSAPSASTGSTIYRSLTAEGPYSVLATNVTGSTYLDNSVTNGVGYFYYAQAYRGTDFNGYPSTKSGGTPGAIPSAPTNLRIISDSSNSPNLYWTAPTNFNRFNIYTSSAPGGPFVFLGNSTTNTYTDSSPNDEMTYYYVTASWGQHETAATNTVSFRKSLVGGLSAVGSGTGVALSWSGVANAQDYRIYRAASSGGAYSSIAIVGTLSYDDTSMAAGDGYWYRVSARFSDGSEGLLSGEVTARRSGTYNPSAFSVTGRTGASISVAWPTVTGVTTYRMYKATNMAGPFTLTQAISNTTSYTYTGLSANTSYYFKVAAMQAGVEYPSAVLHGATLVDPSAPSADVGNNRLDVSWAPVGGASSYMLERSTDLTNFTTVASGIVGTSYADNGVTNGNIYFYRLTASFAEGNTTSPNSIGYTPGVTPQVPSGISVVDNSTSTDLVFTWAAVSGATKYNLYMSTTSGVYSTPIQSTTSNTNVLVSGLTAGTIYYFKVSALNGTLESGLSNEIAVIPQSTPPAPLLRAASSTTIDLTWTAVPSAATYNILRSDTGASFFTIATGVAATTYTDTPPDPAQTYYYRYQPVGSGGTRLAISAVSSSIEITTAPEAPSSLLATVTDLSTVKLDWTSAPQAVTYEVFRSTTSGSGYVSRGTITAPTTTFDDTVSAGTTYYYVARTTNLNGVSSINSNEASVSIQAAPTGVSSSDAATGIQVSWTAVGGATSYIVSRSTQSGGPYGIVAAPSGTTTVDTTVTPGLVYYYVVKSVFASGASSIDSSEVSATKSGRLSLQVPIEMIDRGLASLSSGARTFERSRTDLNTNDYDGVVTYSLEAVVQNQDGGDHTIDLIDATSATVATLTVPGSTFDRTRFAIPISLSAGAQSLKLRLAQTASDTSLLVHSARLLVTQTNATKTRLYVPLLAYDNSPTTDDALGAINTTNSSSLDTTTYTSGYLRKTASLSRIVEYNAWELNALVATTGGAKGQINLQNTTMSQNVPGTETEFSDSSIQLAQVQIDEGVNYFSTSNENNVFKIGLKCTLGCASGTASVYKAGLWVRLENLTQAEVLYRTSMGASTLFSNTTFDQNRTLVDLGLFTSPTVRLQAEATTGSMASASIELLDDLTDDSGLNNLSSISGATVNFGTNEDAIYRSMSFTPTSGHRHMTSVVPSGGSMVLKGSYLVITSGP